MIILNTMDKISTLFGISAGFTERNPLIIYLVNFYGLLGGIFVASIIGMVGILLMYDTPKIPLWVWKFTIVFYGVVVIGNILTILEVHLGY